MYLISQISDSKQILIWPEFSWGPFLEAGIFLILLSTIIYLVQKGIGGRNRRNDSLRAEILAKFRLKEFASKDAILFHEFLHQVPTSKLPKMAADPAWFRKYLIPAFLQFLVDHTNLPVWNKISMIRVLDDLQVVPGSALGKCFPVILEVSPKQMFPAILQCSGLAAISSDQRIPVEVYTKTGTDSFLLFLDKKVRLYFRDELKQWLRVDANIHSHNDANLILYIRTDQELFKPNESHPMLAIDQRKPSVSIKSSASEILSVDYVDSLSTILAYSGLSENFCGQLKNLVKDYKDHPGFIRRQHRQEDYKILITLYKACFIKFRSQTENIPKPVLLFIYFFFLDEGLLSVKRITELEQAIVALKSVTALIPNSEVKLSIHLLPNWLNLVLSGKRNPSKNQMGQTYDQARKAKLLWNQGPELKDLRDKEYLLHLLDWEIDSLLYMGFLGISLNAGKSYPILSEDLFYGETDGNLLYAHKIFAGVDRVLKSDTGLFRRRVCVTSPTNRGEQNWIRKEFFADCILLPFGGDRGVLWQETSEGNLARSRLLFPTIFKGDIVLAVAKTLGEFRWETERTFRGRKWKDLVPATLVSEYFDYLENFKQSQKLTTEAKRRLEQQWTRARRNMKDMFSIDYADLILFEGEGKPRLNRITKGIFSKFIPIENLVIPK